MKRVFLILSLIIVLGCLAILTTSIGVVVLMKIEFRESKVPEAYLKPELRKLEIWEASHHEEVSSLGLTLEVPWVEIVDRKEQQGLTLVKFSQNRSLAIIPSPEGIAESLESLLDRKPEETERIKDFLREQSPKSNYDFYELILNSHPDQVSIFMSRKEAIAKVTLVAMKAMLVISTAPKGKIYSFSTEDIRGFQFGDPEMDDNIVIEFFDSHDKQYSLIIKGANQNEIDFILYSIRIL